MTHALAFLAGVVVGAALVVAVVLRWIAGGAR